MHLYFVGLDVHKQVIAFCVKTADGVIVMEGSIPATRAALDHWGLFENPNRALASIGEFRSLSRAHRRELTGLRRNYSDILDKELTSAVKAGIVRKDIPVSMLRLALFNYLNLTPRWYRNSGPLTLGELAAIYDKVFFEGIAAPGRARPSVSQPQNPRRTRSGSAHSGTLGKFCPHIRRIVFQTGIRVHQHSNHLEIDRHGEGHSLLPRQRQGGPACT